MAEVERLRREGRARIEREQKERAEAAAAEAAQSAAAWSRWGRESPTPPQEAEYDLALKVKWSKGTTADANTIRLEFSRFGEVDGVLVSTKAKKRTAVVSLGSLAAALRAHMYYNDGGPGEDGRLRVSWAGKNHPPKAMYKAVGDGSGDGGAGDGGDAAAAAAAGGGGSGGGAPAARAASLGSAVAEAAAAVKQASANVSHADYEDLTMMNMRRAAERARLIREMEEEDAREAAAAAAAGGGGGGGGGEIASAGGDDAPATTATT